MISRVRAFDARAALIVGLGLAACLCAPGPAVAGCSGHVPRPDPFAGLVLLERLVDAGDHASARPRASLPGSERPCRGPSCSGRLPTPDPMPTTGLSSVVRTDALGRFTGWITPEPTTARVVAGGEPSESRAPFNPPPDRPPRLGG